MKFNRDVPKNELGLAAIHMAGHAVCLAVQGLPVNKVEIKKNGVGKCKYSWYGGRIIPSEESVKYAQAKLAGYITELLFLPIQADRSRVEQEIEEARDILRDMKIDNLEKAMNDAWANAEEIVIRHKEAIYKVAGELLLYGSLNGDQVKKVVEDCR